MLFAPAKAAVRIEAVEISAMLTRIPSSELLPEILLDCPPEFAVGESSTTAEKGLLETAVFLRALPAPQRPTEKKNAQCGFADIFNHDQPIASPAQCAEFEDVAFPPVHAMSSVRSKERFCSYFLT